MTLNTSQDDELAGTEKPFVEHLVELRDRLIYSLIAVGIVALVLAIYPGPGRLYDWLAQPLVESLPEGGTLIATSVISPFIVPLKILLMSAFMIALPFVLYQLWAFVAPGLYMHEKRLVLPLVISSTLLFFVGVAFSYYVILRRVFEFIQGFAPRSITAAPDIEAYLGFVLSLFLAFGLAFEVPVATMVLVRIGVVDVARLRSWRGYFWVFATIVAAIVTPADVFSMLSLMAVMFVLYEVGILGSQLLTPKTQEKNLKNDGVPETTQEAGAEKRI